MGVARRRPFATRSTFLHRVRQPKAEVQCRRAPAGPELPVVCAGKPTASQKVGSARSGPSARAARLTAAHPCRGRLVLGLANEAMSARAAVADHTAPKLTGRKLTLLAEGAARWTRRLGLLGLLRTRRRGGRARQHAGQQQCGSPRYPYPAHGLGYQTPDMPPLMKFTAVAGGGRRPAP